MSALHAVAAAQRPSERCGPRARRSGARDRHHLGLIALFFALTGTSYAVATGSIDSREIRNNSVRSKDVRNNTLRSRDLRDNSVRSADVRDSALISADVLDASLNGGDLANGSVEGLDVRDGTLRDPARPRHRPDLGLERRADGRVGAQRRGPERLAAGAGHPGRPAGERRERSL